MCGLVGFLGGSIKQHGLDETVLLKRMADKIIHRGPNDEGYWCDVDRHIGLGHRRLSILDLSAAGHQPMHSASGRYVLAFNGEIYNHLDLRHALEGQISILSVTRERAALNDGETRIQWRGHSDTETLLAGFEAWGILGTLERSSGMFALAVWDRASCTLTLARDRIGEKPLYYGWHGDTFLFGSELKALRAHPAFQTDVDRGALCLLLRHGYIPAPYSIYNGIAKLRPGCMLSVSLQQTEPNVVVYWSGAAVAVAGVANGFAGSPTQAVDELESLLADAVRQQMIADVPLGAFLSGGIDSSTIVALMQRQADRPVKTFSIGFDEAGYNEATHAKAVAKHLGTNHTELYVTAKDLMAVIPDMPTIYDEPFADSSQIPTLLVSQLAKERVTVSLSGDGGDELFCGYNHYKNVSRIWRCLSALPAPLTKLIVQGVTSIEPHTWNCLSAMLPHSFRGAKLGDKLHKAAYVMASNSAESLHLKMISHWDVPESVVVGGHEPPTLLTGNALLLTGLDQTQRFMALDMLSYLPDDILVKVDRAAMSVSLESRVPFLDHRVVEFAWHLPQSMKLRDGQSKWALRQVLYRHVPRALIERPKMGFGVPIDAWLRGPLHDWADALLDEERLRREGYFHASPIRRRWEEHLSGVRNWHHSLWNVLMFQAWLETVDLSV